MKTKEFLEDLENLLTFEDDYCSALYRAKTEEWIQHALEGRNLAKKEFIEKWRPKE